MGGAKSLGKSVFKSREDLKGLINAAEAAIPVKQAGGNLARTVGAARTIGIDHLTGQPASTYTVVTKSSGQLVSAFPGRP